MRTHYYDDESYYFNDFSSLPQAVIVCCVAGRVRVASDYYKISTCNTITVRVLILLWVVVSTLLGVGDCWVVVIVCPLRQF